MPKDRGRATGLAIQYIEPGDGDPRHGTANGYTNLRCRCRACQVAWAADVRAQQAKRRGSLRPDDPRHGTYNGYRNYGCRCDECRSAHREYSRDYYERHKRNG